MSRVARLLRALPDGRPTHDRVETVAAVAALAQSSEYYTCV